MTRRFWVEPDVLDGSDDVRIEGGLAHRLARVLRMRAGDEIALFDGTGVDALVRLSTVDNAQVSGSIVRRDASPEEPRVRLNLYQSITKGERFEWLLEKGTEIGVSRFVPLITARAVVKTEAGGNRGERWRRIVVEAAEQCGRGAVPDVDDPKSFTDAIAGAPGVVLLPYEAADARTPDIQTALNTDIDALFALSEVSVFIGPEGGYEDTEVQAALDAGAAVVTMGRRVMRSETAGLVSATLVMQAIGELS